MKEPIVNALVAKYKAQIAEHKVNIDVLLEKQVGVAEHPGIIETIDLEVTKLAEAEDKLYIVENNFVIKPQPRLP